MPPNKRDGPQGCATTQRGLSEDQITKAARPVLYVESNAAGPRQDAPDRGIPAAVPVVSGVLEIRLSDIDQLRWVAVGSRVRVLLGRQRFPPVGAVFHLAQRTLDAASVEVIGGSPAAIAIVVEELQRHYRGLRSAEMATEVPDEWRSA